MPRGITIRSPSREKTAPPPSSPVTEAEEPKKEKILGPYDDTLFAPVYFPPPRSVLVVDLLVQGLCVKVSQACWALLSQRLCFIGSVVLFYWVRVCGDLLGRGLQIVSSWLVVYEVMVSCGLLDYYIFWFIGLLLLVVYCIRDCISSQGLLIGLGLVV